MPRPCFERLPADALAHFFAVIAIVRGWISAAFGACTTSTPCLNSAATLSVIASGGSSNRRSNVFASRSLR